MKADQNLELNNIYKTELFKNNIKKEFEIEETLNVFSEETIKDKIIRAPYFKYINKTNILTKKYKAQKNDYGYVQTVIEPEINALYNDFLKIKKQNKFTIIKHGEEVEIDEMYYKFKVPKRNKRGQFRELINASLEIRKIHDHLKIYFNKMIDDINNGFPDSCQAFTENRSIYTNALKHKNSKIHLSLDIKNFFPSITKELIQKILPQIYGFCYLSKKAIEKISEMVTYEGTLPQGTSVSPLLSNVIAMPLDYALQKMVRGTAVVYTRYADDISLSSDVYGALPKRKDLEEYVEKIQNKIDEIYEGLLKINNEKTKLQFVDQRMIVTGILIHNHLGNGENTLSIGKRKKAMKSRLLRLLDEYKNSPQNLLLEEIQQVNGEFAYLKLVEPITYEKYLESLFKTLKLDERKINIKNIWKVLLDAYRSRFENTTLVGEQK